MKRLLFLLGCSTFFVFAQTSCGGGSETPAEDTTKVETVDFTGMQSFDLTPHGIKSQIMVPEESSPMGGLYPVEVTKDEDMLTWDIVVGKGYHVIIEEADGEGDYLNREKERLKNDVVFTETFLKDEENGFVYKAALPEGAGQKDYYHTFGTVKINNIDYVVRSDAFGEFSEVQAEDMFKSIKSLAGAKAEA